MLKNTALLARLELVWWLITAIIAVMILAPIIYKLPDYQFLWPNLVFILVMVTFTRYIFFLKYTFLATWRNIKVAIIFLCVFIAFLLVQEVNLFQTFLDENGVEAIVGSLPRTEQGPMMKFIKSEMLLFGVGAVITCGVLPLRLVVSIWRRWNGYED
ncbi:MAG: hypothetical protein ACRBG0_07970 [Lewinella sp.]|jgi:hypothetical protein|uniref:hypothetical protein n=1 Tax=Lewinella sp. TaxID=2004506 RepID=UPI003D6B7F94